MRFILPLSYRESVSLLRKTIKESGGDKYVSVIVQPEVLKVKVSYLGKSELVFMIAKENDSTEFELVEENLCAVHRAHKGWIEKFIKRTVKKGEGKCLA